MISFIVKKVIQKSVTRINMVLAYIFFKFYTFFCDTQTKKNLWLIGGSGGTKFDDNAKPLYEYIKTSYPEISIFWIANGNSEVFHELSKNGDVIRRNSIKNCFYSLTAEVVITTHGLDDVTPYDSKRLNSIKIHLFHGVTAFKKKHSNIKNYLNYDILIASGTREKLIKVQNFNLKPEKVCITGFPQHDTLIYKQKRKELERQNLKILYFPTWRNWLRTKKAILKGSREFESSKFFKNISELISSRRLNNLLDQYNIELNVCIHRNMHVYIKSFVNLDSMKNVNILTGPDIQNEIVENDILITDYSSVAWEFLLLCKPVIFYAFDIDEYKKKQGSYINIPEEMFGPVVYDTESVICEINKFVLGNCSDNQYNDLRKEFLQFADGNNCKRIVETIFKCI